MLSRQLLVGDGWEDVKKIMNMCLSATAYKFRPAGGQSRA
jgi:hypothetical protein